MKLSALVPLALSLVSLSNASGVHKLKLQKLPPTKESNAFLETAYLAEKYGAQNQVLLGAGGSGRRLRNQDGEQMFYTQEQLKGGHNVPLSSA